MFLVNIDLVGYSKRTEPEQYKFAKEFHQKLPEFIIESNITNPIIIPTGDGIFLGYEDIADEDYLKIIRFIFSIKRWAENLNMQFRSAINYGQVSILENDINNNKNLVGNLVNDTSRIISAGEDDALIIHKNYFDSFIKGKDKIDIFELTKIDNGIVLDKHHYSHICYSYMIKHRDMTIGNPNKLILNYLTEIYSPEIKKIDNLIESFHDRIKKASSVIFYGIYNSSVLESIQEIDFTDNRPIDITVIYAADELKVSIEKFFNSNTGKLDFSNKKNSIESVKSFCSTKNIKLHLKEYVSMPTFGASFIDYSSSGNGFMHISNYLRNVIPDDTPFFELQYLTDIMPYLYKYYYNHFNNDILRELKEIK